MEFTDLNIDCLLRIFSFCRESDLFNLCRAHSFLRNVIEMHIFQLQSLDLLMCGHRNFPKIIDRTHIAMSFEDRVKVAANWLSGRYKEQQYFRRSKMFATKLVLEQDWLYLTFGCYLSQHRRLKIEPLQRRYFCEITTGNKADLADFVKRKDTIFAGRITGNCFIYEEDYATEQQLHNPNEYLRCVNFFDGVYATSTDNCCRLWQRTEEFGLLHLDQIMEFNESFKALQFNTDGKKLYGGMYTSANRRALREIDIESEFQRILNSKTISVYDLKLKDDNIIFTANFDTSFRLYDRRTDKDECVWEDPFDSSFYCLDYDGLYAVLCGTKYHSRVNLYDIRVPNKYMQLYFPRVEPRRRDDLKSSPVYSLACDSRYLFIATDRTLHVLDFKVSCAAIKDYRNIFQEMYRI